MAYYLAHWKYWLWSIGVVAAAVVFGLAAHYLFFALAKRLARRTTSNLDDFLVRYVEPPSKLILPLLCILAVLPFVPLSPNIVSPFRHAVGLVLIAALTWLAISLIDFLQDFITSHHAIKTSDNLAARRIQTQVQVLRHVAVFLTIVVAVAIMLMTFPTIRHVGESLFASAGIATIVAGLAARSTFTNLIAGVQVALTQPIRLDDVVIVEGEFGWIEEIRTTYVVVRVWDLRRLVVPLSYFIEKPFQNWTRQTSDLLGTVFVYTDYTVPVDDVRAELHRILESSGQWDGKVWGLQVTNASERSLELRALMSSPTASQAWDLRCHVREKLIQFLQEKYPESLPRARAELTKLPSGNDGSRPEQGLEFTAPAKQ